MTFDIDQRPAAHRAREILDLLRSIGGTSRIQPLAAALQVSEETIRRNVKRLADQGLVEKVHGGVHLVADVGEPSFNRRFNENPDEKRVIAAEVAHIIGDGDSLFLDVGSTTAYVARALRNHRDLFVVTNSIEVAQQLATRNGNRVFMAGGELRAHDAGAFGIEAIDFVRNFQVKYAVLSAAAIDAVTGFMLFDLQEAQFSEQIAARAETRIVAADSTKFDRTAPIAVDSAIVDMLVTNAPPPKAIRDAMISWSVDVIVARQGGPRSIRR